MTIRGRERDAGIDAVRGLALLSMFVAHTAPSLGPGRVLALADFLTAALFAVLIGAGMGMRRRPGGLFAALLRGAVLVLLGLLLEQTGSLVVVILVHLGVLTWVMALLRPYPSWALTVLAAVLYGLAPRLSGVFRPVYADLVASGWSTPARLLDLAFTHPYYRLTGLTFWALLGMLAARLVLGSREKHRAREVALGTAALLAAAALYSLSQRGWGSLLLHPYLGQPADLLFNGLFALAILLLGASVAGGASWLVDLGRMSLSVYCLHVLWLALVARVIADSGSDDAWWVLASLVIGATALAAGWSRARHTSRWGRGPLEGLVDRLVRPFD